MGVPRRHAGAPRVAARHPRRVRLRPRRRGSRRPDRVATGGRARLPRDAGETVDERVPSGAQGCANARRGGRGVRPRAVRLGLVAGPRSSPPPPRARGLLRRRRVRDPRREPRRTHRIPPRCARTTPPARADVCTDRPRGGGATKKRRWDPRGCAHRRLAGDGTRRGALAFGPEGLRGVRVDVRWGEAADRLPRARAQTPSASAPRGWAGVDAGEGTTKRVGVHAAAPRPAVDRADANGTGTRSSSGRRRTPVHIPK